jgi:hypothetical protein
VQANDTPALYTLYVERTAPGGTGLWAASVSEKVERGPADDARDMTR